MVKVRRIIRRKGSDVAVPTGKVRQFDSLAALADFTRKQRKVFAFMIDNGSQGTMRSGRRMRWTDLHVRNVVDSRLFQSPGSEQLELF